MWPADPSSAAVVANGPACPPGQYDTGNQWPVLTAEVTPRVDTSRWTMTVDGLVEQPTRWTWDEIHALPPSEYVGAIHCVTTWSKLDTQFAGVSVDTLLDQARPQPTASHVLATSTTGYTTNMPLDHLRGGQAWVCLDLQPPATTLSTTAARSDSWCRTSTSGSRPSGSPG